MATRSQPKPKENMFDRMLAIVRRVPKGKVSTYGDIAYAAGFPGAARQVSWALHQSKPSIPWQRIVGAGGKILLSGELGFDQRMRLRHEGIDFIGLKVDMRTHRTPLSSLTPRPPKA